jgi:hypothetical protein
MLKREALDIFIPAKRLQKNKCSLINVVLI